MKYLASLGPMSRFFDKIPISETYYFDDPRNVQATGVSHDLLLLRGVTPSLTEYLTSRTRAKNLYVDTDTYHTQMVEFWADRWGPEMDDKLDEYVIFHLASSLLKVIFVSSRIETKKRDEAGNHWKFHLVRARPSQQIFARLRVLSSQSFIEASGPPSDSFRVIIAWLEVCRRIEQLLQPQVLMISPRACPRHLSTFICGTRCFF